jgi:hypothetical protein
MENKSAFTNDFLAAKRLVGDTNADLFTQSVFNNSDQKIELGSWLTEFNNNLRLGQIPQQFAGYSLFSNVGQLPPWADKREMKAGSAFFARNAQLIMNLLGLLSLPYCYTAADGAMVLYLSDRMRGDVGKRLVETADFLWDVMAPDAFEEAGKGFASILKIRIIHAAVRYYTLKSGKWHDARGLPVNQEDMAGTNLSFSLIVIRGLRKFGISVTYPEQQAFMHLWNVIGYLLGIQEDLLPNNGKQAFDLEEAIRVRQFKVSDHGRDLTRSLVHYFTTVNTGEQFTDREILQVMRYLLGNPVADMLDLPSAELPVTKIRTLKAVNFINGLINTEKASIVYHNEYSRFNRNKPVFA